MTYDEILKEPSGKEKILQFIYDSKKLFVGDELDESWNSALEKVEDFIENKL